MMLPDRFIDQGSPAGQMAEAGLDAAAIVAKVRETLEAFDTHPQPMRTAGAKIGA